MPELPAGGRGRKRSVAAALLLTAVAACVPTYHVTGGLNTAQGCWIVEPGRSDTARAPAETIKVLRSDKVPLLLTCGDFPGGATAFKLSVEFPAPEPEPGRYAIRRTLAGNDPGRAAVRVHRRRTDEPTNLQVRLSGHLIVEEQRSDGMLRLTFEGTGRDALFGW